MPPGECYHFIVHVGVIQRDMMHELWNNNEVGEAKIFLDSLSVDRHDGWKHSRYSIRYKHLSYNIVPRWEISINTMDGCWDRMKTLEKQRAWQNAFKALVTGNVSDTTKTTLRNFTAAVYGTKDDSSLNGSRHQKFEKTYMLKSNSVNVLPLTIYEVLMPLEYCLAKQKSTLTFSVQHSFPRCGYSQRKCNCTAPTDEN